MAHRREPQHIYPTILMDGPKELHPVRVPESIVFALKGILVGIADIIPGVSGGTLALITGIYERMIHALRTLSARFVLQYLRGDRDGAREALRSMDFRFLVPFLLGIAAAVLLLAQVFIYLLDNQAGPTYAFFFGLILASAGFVTAYIDRLDGRHLASGIAGFVLVVLLVGLEQVTSNHSLAMIFTAGFVAIGAMLLPGISGSLVLLIIGQYEHMLEVLSNVELREILVFGAGAVTGVVLFSRALDYLLQHHRSITMAFLFGCMLGALRLPAEIMVDVTDTSSAPAVAVLVVLAVVGFLSVYSLERWSTRLKEATGIVVEE